MCVSIICKVHKNKRNCSIYLEAFNVFFTTHLKIIYC